MKVQKIQLPYKRDGERRGKETGPNQYIQFRNVSVLTLGMDVLNLHSAASLQGCSHRSWTVLKAVMSTGQNIIIYVALYFIDQIFRFCFTALICRVPLTGLAAIEGYKV